jgi:hypothetical protein
MSDYTPPYSSGTLPFTMTAAAAITGGQVCVSTGVGTVGPAAGPSGVCVGVAAHDAATGTKVTLWQIPGVVHESLSTAAITSGASLSSGAAGAVTSGTLGTLAAAGTLLGTALSTVAGAGLVTRWLGR